MENEKLRAKRLIWLPIVTRQSSRYLYSLHTHNIYFTDTEKIWNIAKRYYEKWHGLLLSLFTCKFSPMAWLTLLRMEQTQVYKPLHLLVDEISWRIFGSDQLWKSKEIWMQIVNLLGYGRGGGGGAYIPEGDACWIGRIVCVWRQVPTQARTQATIERRT